MKRPIRLTATERNSLNVDQKMDRMWLDRIASKLADDLSMIDSDLPEATRTVKEQRLRAQAKLDSAKYLAAMNDRRETAENQSAHFGRANVLRRASLNASPAMQQRVATAPDHELLAFAEDAVADTNLVLAGVVQAELVRRALDQDVSRGIGTVLAEMPIPELAEAAPLLTEIRNIALESEMLVRDLAGERDPVFLLTAGRIMESPIFEPSA